MRRLQAVELSVMPVMGRILTQMSLCSCKRKDACTCRWRAYCAVSTWPLAWIGSQPRRKDLTPSRSWINSSHPLLAKSTYSGLDCRCQWRHHCGVHSDAQTTKELDSQGDRSRAECAQRHDLSRIQAIAGWF